MRAVVVGRGVLGDAVRRALEQRGVETEVVSRSSGFDVRDPGPAPDLGPADAIVEATNLFALSPRKATAFFTASTRTVGAAARAAGARHVLVSIVGCDKPEVTGYGYFVGKAEQERVARQESDDLTIVATTQFFEFAAQTAQRMRVGPVGLLPRMLIQPLAVDAAAAVVAEVAAGDRTAPRYELAGPETMTLLDLATAHPALPVRPVPLPFPGRTGRSLRDGALLPGPDAEIVGPRAAEWLAAQR